MTRSPAYCITFLALCATLWLAPFFHAGAKKTTWRFLPHPLRHQHSAAALFTTEVRSWSDRQLEVQRADGSRFMANEREHFPMGAFGFRTRYDRIMSQVVGRRYGSGVRRRIAAYVLQRERKRLGISGEPLHLRLVRAQWKVGHPDLARPGGAWSVPPSTELESPHRFVAGGYSLSAENKFSAFFDLDDTRTVAQRGRSRGNVTVIHAPAKKKDGTGGKAAARDLRKSASSERGVLPRKLVPPEEDAVRHPVEKSEVTLIHAPAKGRVRKEEEKEVICCGGDWEPQPRRGR